MLPAAHRLRRSPDFTAVVRGAGATRAGSRRLVVHVNRRGAPAADLAHPEATADAGPAPRVGFVVSKAVGNAVVRNRTKRVLRHLVAARVNRLPTGAEAVDVVVRANPAAAGATTADLAAELDRNLAAALGKLAGDRGPRRAAPGTPSRTREVR